MNQSQMCQKCTTVTKHMTLRAHMFKMRCGPVSKAAATSVEPRAMSKLSSLLPLISAITKDGNKTPPKTVSVKTVVTATRTSADHSDGR